MRKPLLNNIYLCGGGSRLTGISERLTNELSSLLAGTKLAKAKVRVSGGPSSDEFSEWLVSGERKLQRARSHTHTHARRARRCLRRFRPSTPAPFAKKSTTKLGLKSSTAVVFNNNYNKRLFVTKPRRSSVHPVARSAVWFTCATTVLCCSARWCAAHGARWVRVFCDRNNAGPAPPAVPAVTQQHQQRGVALLLRRRGTEHRHSPVSQLFIRIFFFCFSPCLAPLLRSALRRWSAWPVFRLLC